MEFTQEIADRYVGGQVEITFGGDVDVYQGQIASIQVTEDPQLGRQIEITLAWKAVLRDDADEWVAIDGGTYRANARFYAVYEIGDGEIAIVSHDGNSATLIPPDGQTLDPASVVGLNHPQEGSPKGASSS